MPDSAVKIAIVAGFLVFTGFSLVLLVRPSLHFHWFPNPFMPDTPWNRIQMRALGLVFSLFALMVFSGILRNAMDPEFGEGFHTNLLLALWVVFIAFFVVGNLAWVLSRFSRIRGIVCRHYPAEKVESSEWERQMTTIFGLVLLFIVGTALAFAAMGHHF